MGLALGRCWTMLFSLPVGFWIRYLAVSKMLKISSYFRAYRPDRIGSGYWHCKNIGLHAFLAFKLLHKLSSKHKTVPAFEYLSQHPSVYTFPT